MDSPFGRSRAAEPSLPAVAGVKRSAQTATATSTLTPTPSSTPALLPAFEPLSSSPALPRMIKMARGHGGSNGGGGVHARNAFTKYPTPVPTSSTGIMSSPRPTGASVFSGAAASAVPPPERMPLGAVPSVELSENGEPVLMGRSSHASHYQLSANRLISRVHVRARYVPPTRSHGADAHTAGHVEVVCCGWNGLRLHCQGRAWDLAKGDTFTTETENTELMIDVQDARVRVRWPRRGAAAATGASALSDSSWDSPRSARSIRSMRSIRSPHSPRSPHARSPGAAAARRGVAAPGASALASSPLRRAARIASPESPTPARVPASGASLQALLSQHPDSGDEGGDVGVDDHDHDDSSPIHIYEDASGDDEPELPRQPADAGVSFSTERLDSFSSELSELHSVEEAGDSQGDQDDQDDRDDADPEDPDEENDPIVHSFGPFGADLSSRLAAFAHDSPKASRQLGSKHKKTTPVVRPSTPEARGAKRMRREDGSDESTEASGASRASVEASPERSAEGVGLGISVSSAAAATPAAAPPLISAHVDVETVRNHLINQLAFSRLSSSPLSTIMNNLPAEERRDLTHKALRHIIEGTACVGVIKRQGKDAAGQPLESEYYYVSDRDADASRRAVVDGLRKPSLRNCRKQHKQYYWKKPRTP